MLETKAHAGAATPALDRCLPSNSPRGRLEHRGLRTLGELDGETVAGLCELRRFGRVQARELLQLLVSNDLVDAPPRCSGGPDRQAPLRRARGAP